MERTLLGGKLIVGLGNPGPDYEYTRHNLGFLVVQDLARRFDIVCKSNRSLKGVVGRGKVEGTDVTLLFPMTYMNNSGESLRAVTQDLLMDLQNILVLADDFNLEFGQLRLRDSGSDGGHNGLKSVIAHLKSSDFARLRLGIGSPADKSQVVDYVLSEFSGHERVLLKDIISQAGDCCVEWLTKGIKEAMNQFNKRKKNEQL